MKRVFAALLFTAVSSVVAVAQTESRADVLKAIEAKRAELAKLETSYLSPSAEDRAAYSEFLSQPDTGMFRLLPREKFDSYANPKSGMTVNGGGSYYSFVRLTHEYGQGVEIGFEQGQLKTGFGGYDYGMLTKLEGAGLEDVSFELPGVMSLANYTPVTRDTEARAEQRRFQLGTEIAGAAYKDRVKVELGATYLLRNISWERSDVLVTFKVVRQDTDGSLIIAWKLLQKNSPPKLARKLE